MIETHHFGAFVPQNSKYLILGSFPGKKMNYKKDIDVWFYTGSGRNQFWPILEEVYKTELNTRKEKKELLRKLKIALADIIYKCERKKYSNLDVNLINITYAINSISIILKNNPVEKIFFSSRFVEDKFKRHFKDLIQKYPKIELITFPSPSPRYTAMSKDEKIKRFKEVLPQLT
jgi:hypoxanthine-DNA glycosylase